MRVAKTESPNFHLASGASFGILGSLVKSILVYGYGIALARIAGADTFGLYTLAFSIIFILFFVGEMGLTTGSIRYVSIAAAEDDWKKVKGIITGAARYVFLVSIGTSILLSLLVPVLVNYYQKPLLGPVLWVFAAALPFTTLTNLFVSVAQGLKSIREKVLAKDILQPFVEIFVGVGGVVLISRLEYEASTWVGVAYLISVIISCLVAYFKLTRLFPGLRDSTLVGERIDRQLLIFSRPLMISRLTSIIAFRLGLLLLGVWYANSIVAYYGAVIQTTQTLSLFLVAFSAMLGPYIAEAVASSDKQMLRQIYTFSTRWIIALSSPLVLIIIFAAEEILGLFGPEYVQASRSLIILTIAQLINLSVGATDTILIMAGHSRLDAINNIVLLILTVSTGIFLVPNYGLFGAALTQGVAIAFINILKLLQIYRYYGVWPMSTPLARYLVAVVGSFIFTYLLQNMISEIGGLTKLVILAMSVIGFYVLCVFLIGINQEDKLVLQQAYALFAGKEL